MRIRPIALSAALLAALGLAACGPGSSTESSPSSSKAAAASPSASAGKPSDLSGTFQQAYDNTVNSKTAKVSPVVKVSVTGKASTITINGDGVAQFTPPAADLTLTATGKKSRLVVVDGTQYMQVSGASSWIKPHLSGASAASNQMVDPTVILSFLQGVSSQVKTTGTKTIRGARAAGYRATIDLDKVAAKQSGAPRDATKSIKQFLKGSTVPVKVWLDKQGRLVREQVAVTLTQSDEKITFDTTIDLYDYGTAVSIQAPK